MYLRNPNFFGMSSRSGRIPSPNAFESDLPLSGSSSESELDLDFITHVFSQPEDDKKSVDGKFIIVFKFPCNPMHVH